MRKITGVDPDNRAAVEAAFADIEPQAIACMDESICIPGRFSGLNVRQLTPDGTLSISKNGCFFIARIIWWPADARTAAGTSSFCACHWG